MNLTGFDLNLTYLNTTNRYCPPELKNACVEILFNSTEKALSIFILAFITVGVLLIFRWLHLLWKAQRVKSYRAAIKVRRPSYLILSYIAICPWLLVNAFDEVYLFWNEKKDWYEDESKWTSNGLPIYYTPTIDIILHFGFWFGFWAFFQLKIFKLWMLRYDYEYSMELNNMEWKENLGLRTVQGASFFIRYRGWLGNPLLMCFFQLVILIIIIFFQTMIRFLITSFLDSSEALLYEFYWVIFVLITELLSMVWLTHKIRSIEDNFFLKPESNRMFITYVVGGIIYGASLSVWQVRGVLPPYIYTKLVTLLCSTSLAVVYCYWETIWVLKRLKYEEKNARAIRRSMKKGTRTLRLTDVLSVKDGFEAMMRFLVKEFSCENLLCYVELTQYIEQWKPITRVSIHTNAISSSHSNKVIVSLQKTIKLQSSSNNNMGDNSNLGLYNTDYEDLQEPSTSIQDRIRTSGDVVLQPPSDISVFINSNVVDTFPYFEDPEFDDELTHYSYIMQKYIYNSACLQINISHNLRSRAMNQSPGQSSIDLYSMIDDIRNDLWRLMGDSFTRFRSTKNYVVLCQKTDLNVHNGHVAQKSQSRMKNRKTHVNTISNISDCIDRKHDDRERVKSIEDDYDDALQEKEKQLEMMVREQKAIEEQIYREREERVQRAEAAVAGSLEYYSKTYMQKKKSSTGYHE